MRGKSNVVKTFLKKKKKSFFFGWFLMDDLEL